MRKRYISRTIKSIKCKVLCIDKKSKETFNTEEVVTGDFKTEDKLIKYLHEKIDTEDVCVVTVLETAESEALYSMLEEDFVKFADVVKKRYRAVTPEPTNENAES